MVGAIVDVRAAQALKYRVAMSSAVERRQARRVCVPTYRERNKSMKFPGTSCKIVDRHRIGLPRVVKTCEADTLNVPNGATTQPPKPATSSGAGPNAYTRYLPG